MLKLQKMAMHNLNLDAIFITIHKIYLIILIITHLF